MRQVSLPTVRDHTIHQRLSDISSGLVETPDDITDFEEVKFGSDYRDLERGEKVEFPVQIVPTFASAFNSREFGGGTTMAQSMGYPRPPSPALSRSDTRSTDSYDTYHSHRSQGWHGESQSTRSVAQPAVRLPPFPISSRRWVIE